MEKNEKKNAMAGHEVQDPAARRRALIELYNSLQIPRPLGKRMKA